ncbi:prolyl endopeptidase [Poronia punctata]|nr:prolyl endopeptidase [Poronia punctata]
MSSPTPSPLSKTQPILRIARPTDSIAALLPFYTAGLGFVETGSFKDHDGFDGVLLSLQPGAAGHHLEFTQNPTHPAVGRAPTKENILVFYLPDETLYKQAVARMRGAGFGAVDSWNPYWDRCGMTFEDNDGYRVVLANMRSPV